MEIIEIAGYTHKEKRIIMDKHILPKAVSDAGLEKFETNFEIDGDTRNFIIENYARDAGCRSLKKYSNRICEKIAYKLVDAGKDDDPTGFHIAVEKGKNLEDFIGPP